MDTPVDDAALLALCARISFSAHQGQYRRDGITPYINHPRAVAARLKTTKEKCVGLLHDVIEDTPLTWEDLLLEGVPEEIIEGVISVSKRSRERYMVYLSRVSQNALGRAAKVEDMLHNLSDNPTRRQIIKYSKGLLFLLEED